MHLQHLHLRSPISYAYSLRLQEALVARQFAHKDILRTHSPRPTTSEPLPTLLTFQTYPTYTVGRRHLKDNPLSESQIQFLTGVAGSNSDGTPTHTSTERLATFYPSPRGGLLTYHAPGQLTAYLVLNLRSHGLTPRCYIRLLEDAVMKTCAEHGVPNVMTTEDPGVWIAERNTKVAQGNIDPSGGSSEAPNQRATNRKICAVGVHISRGITSHGIGLNVFDAPRSRNTSAPGFLSWGFERIVACGLEGKGVTWLRREQQRTGGIQNTLPGTTVGLTQQPKLMASVAETLAFKLAEGLSLVPAATENLLEEDIVGLDNKVQKKRDWKFLTEQTGDVVEDRITAHSTRYRTRDLRADPGLRFG